MKSDQESKYLALSEWERAALALALVLALVLALALALALALIP